MAFGRSDTDLFYEKQILPVLRRNGVRPIIINRHQSNDDLNFQIFEQLEIADFCIADLTYTRPSVYYEAGFAQRSVPVIYTVRKDHLDKGQPDDLRIHFDLQMKPIIEWKTPDDETFGVRLEKRLYATILRSWNRTIRADKKFEDAKTEFDRLSMARKLVDLRRATIYALRKAGIRISHWNEVEALRAEQRFKPSRKDIVSGNSNYVDAFVMNDKAIHYATIQAFGTLRKLELSKMLEEYFYSYPAIRNVDKAQLKKIKRIYSNYVVLSLSPVSVKLIEDVLVHFEPLERSKRYVVTAPLYSYGARLEAKTVTTFHFFSGIRSMLHLRNELDELVSGYLQDQMSK